MTWWETDEENVKRGKSTNKDGHLKYGRLEGDRNSHSSEFYDIRTGMTFGHGENADTDQFGKDVEHAQDNLARDSRRK